MIGTRVAEVMAALSVTTDLVAGAVREEATCLPGGRRVVPPLDATRAGAAALCAGGIDYRYERACSSYISA